MSSIEFEVGDVVECLGDGSIYVIQDIYEVTGEAASDMHGNMRARLGTIYEGYAGWRNVKNKSLSLDMLHKITHAEGFDDTDR